jgi:hypothetical protein
VGDKDHVRQEAGVEADLQRKEHRMRWVSGLIVLFLAGIVMAQTGQANDAPLSPTERKLFKEYHELLQYHFSAQGQDLEPTDLTIVAAMELDRKTRVASAQSQADSIRQQMNGAKASRPRRTLGSGVVRSSSEGGGEAARLERAYREAMEKVEQEKRTYRVSMDLDLSRLDVGSFGLMPDFRVVQVVDDESMMVEVGHKTVLLKGVPTKDLADDDSVKGGVPVEVTGTHRYTTVMGAAKTVMLVEPTRKRKAVPGITMEQFEAVIAAARMTQRDFLALARKHRVTDRDNYALPLALELMRRVFPTTQASR